MPGRGSALQSAWPRGAADALPGGGTTLRRERNRGPVYLFVGEAIERLWLALRNVLNGAVLAECKPRYRHQEFLAFLRTIDKSVPAVI